MDFKIHYKIEFYLSFKFIVKRFDESPLFTQYS